MDADLSHPVVSQSLVESEPTVLLLERPFIILHYCSCVTNYPGTLLAPFLLSVALPSPTYDVSASGYLFMTCV